jgi:hypothetical protein
MYKLNMIFRAKGEGRMVEHGASARFDWSKTLMGGGGGEVGEEPST